MIRITCTQALLTLYVVCAAAFAHAAGTSEPVLAERCPNAGLAEPYDAKTFASYRAAVKRAPRLFQALERGDRQLLKKLLAQGENPRICVFGASLVAHAANNGDIASVDLLARAGAHIDRPLNAAGETPMLHAAAEEQFSMALQLLERGADARFTTPEGGAALHAAAAIPVKPITTKAREQLDLVRALSIHGLGMNAQTREGITALMLATRSGNAPLVTYLVGHGADANLADAIGQTPLNIALMLKREDIAEHLRQAGAQLKPLQQPSLAVLIEQRRLSELAAALAMQAAESMPTKQKQSLLVAAILMGNSDAIVALARWGVDLNAVFETQYNFDNFPTTPLLFAIGDEAEAQVVRTLLQAGVDPDRFVPPAQSATPLLFALSLHDFRSANVLLDGEANPNLADPRDGTTPLIAAVALSAPSERALSTAIIRKLVELGAKPDMRDTRGMTALHWAALAGHADAVKLLLDHGADRNVLDHQRHTPLHYARKERNREIVALLTPRPAK